MNEFEVHFESRYEKALYMAKSWGYRGEEAKRIAKRIFASWVTGAPVGSKNGKLVASK